ncbi:MAG: alpha/beta hydrolase [Rhodospirillales bacterium CG15_BIG_FIL_POST_REV_8_21_14_020_66_15]|nr:MAG: alpha/beta hydrolase [Rhodospirillales bacterium CG15_BIG_FIL_POST_REV_8_21_14_020_66_15]
MDSTAAPKVWRDYDQAELDRQYDQRSIVPDGDDYKADDAKASETARAETDCRIDVAYGGHPDERLDVFPARAPGSPVLVHLHGGGWARGSKSNESFVAPGLVDAGAAAVVVEFSLCPAGTLAGMVDQCRRAVAWVHAHAGEMNAAADRIVISGHSSGSHLAAMMWVTDWAARGLPADVLKGCVVTCGIYELTPVRLSYRNEYLGLDDAAVAQLSPIRRLKPDLPPVALFYGGGELAEFRRQGRDFAQALRDAHLEVAETDIPGLNHFQMGRLLGRPDSPVHRAALRMLGLGG